MLLRRAAIHIWQINFGNFSIISFLDSVNSALFQAEHNFSESGSDYVLMLQVKVAHTQGLSPAQTNYIPVTENNSDSPPFHLNNERDPISRTMLFLV
jgi:hypothetical protein